MNTLIAATGNADKMREIREILQGSDLQVISMKEAGVSVDVEENGTSFTENALIKARAVCHASGRMTIADDSGLVIDALNGEPGIYSARYMGEHTSYVVKNTSILERMQQVPEERRTARFVCAMAVCFPDGREITCEETMEGIIGYRIAGENGFGYDPIFFLPELGKSSAEISPEEKNAISHRGKALRTMRKLLQPYM